ncbi:helix-turn-helix domain-containing protein [Saccharopolyspora sp. 6M]|nr:MULTISPECIES: helix-turn-helix domain-containing protein [unclassified Saccharopolyspora]MCA1229646.1 helix-turn-helix domain-containing protein [Saccharopolyspora sp. 6M]MCA1279269.1 helix-turn-helix domain-containing protein [Saccharopolyspora sp. 7B]
MDNMWKNRAMTRTKVVVLVRPGLQPMELGIVHQLFALATGPGGEPHYEVLTCAPVPGQVRTTGDFEITVPHGPEVLADADLVFVPASDADYVADFALPDDVRDALARVPARPRIASICSGAFVLAAAGLLDGRRATTHWNAADRFRRAFPRVELDPAVLYVDEGPVLTSAGETSGIDLCLHLIREAHGTAVANDVARLAVVPAHRDGGQAQFIRRAVPDPRSSSTARARALALENLHRALPLRELAELESMSVRTFTRRFRDETGLSPVQWLTGQRVERARQLLEETELPVDQIAADAGFGTAASLRQHLRARLGISPSTYRGTFRPGGTDDAA